MIEATHFFLDESADGNGCDMAGEEKVFFSKWLQVSSHSWRLERDDPFGTSRSLQLGGGGASSDADANHQSVLASMDRFLTQQHPPPPNNSTDCTTKKTIQNGNHHPTSHPTTPDLTGFIAGLDICDPRDRWVQDMEAFLKGGDNGLLTKGALSNKSSSSSDCLYQDRLGIAVSAPLRLSAKTLSTSLLALCTSTITPAAAAPPAPPAAASNDRPFCLVALGRSGGTSGSPMEFSSYTGSTAATTGRTTNGEDYVPEGYEEFEALGKETTNEKQNGSNRKALSSPVYFMMEIQDTAVAAGSSSNTQLEDIACVWNDNNNIPAQEHNNNMSAQGIQLKLISCTTWKEILDQQSEREQSGDPDLSWILSELETAAPLRLPQPVGYGWNEKGDAKTVSSIMLIVSLDLEQAKGGHAEQNGKARLLSQLQKRMAHGAIILKFQRHEFVREHPLSSRISMSRFSIGRKFQVAHHQSSEEENILQTLQASMLNAERFIPAWHKQQWDTFPDAWLSVLPHPLLPPNLSRWLLDPMMRRSDFDVSLGNILPMLCQYVDKSMLVGQFWNDIAWIQHGVHQKVAAVQSSTALNVGGPQKGDVDAKYLQEQSCYLERFHFEGSGINPFLQGYLARMLAALQIERFRCFEDMKKHDMYSIHWKGHTVEIAPPTHPTAICLACHASTPGLPLKSRPRHLEPRNAERRAHRPRCAYHMATVYAESESGRSPQEGKPIPIRTKYLLEKLPSLLAMMLPEDCVVVRVHVPGVAEDFPLISIGDFVRATFHGPPAVQLSTEVIAEVADVVVKKEEVVLRLPSPFQRHMGSPICTMGCLPYLQALLHTNDYVVDALPILKAFSLTQTVPQHEAQPINGQNKKEMLDRFRFNVRFGFQGGRGFDIIRQVLTEAMAPARLPASFDPGRKKNMKKKIEAGILLAKHNKDIHMRRVLAPSKTQDRGIVRSVDREIHLRRMDRPGLNFENPVNLQQQRAVADIVYNFHGSAPYIIEGPAGTGKTMCVCEAVVQVFRTSGGEAKILVCAPSDAACDVLASRLLPLLPPKSLLRVNWWSRKVASVKPELLSSCPQDETGGLFTIPSLEELKRANVSVIVCQCFVAESLELSGARGWTKEHFSHLFIDETSQAMECEALVPIMKVGDRCSIVLAGDTKQLAPYIRDRVAATMGLGLSIQERLLQLPLYSADESCTIARLVNNYRSNEALLTIPSNLFYEGTLQALAPQEVANPFQDLGDMGDAGFPLLLCNVSDGEERSKLDTPSFYNMEECHAISSLAQGLLRCKTKEGVVPLHTGQISVIVAFRAQVLALRVVLRAANLGGINVGVVEDFQGQEAKVVFISTVLTREHQRWSQPASTAATTSGDTGDSTSGAQRLGFLHDPRKFNVAITRAHALCVIVGHAEYLEQSGTYWAAMLDHIRRNDGVLGEEDDNNDEQFDDAAPDDDPYGIADLLRRVEALQLLGSGAEEDMHDLSYYYTDVPQWKVMLS